MKSLLVLGVLACVPSLSNADSIRCGSRIITRGSGSAELAAMCGEPTQVNKSSGLQRTLRVSVVRRS